MATVLWDEKVVILVDFVESGSTITTVVYCEILTQLKVTISCGTILFHDNVPTQSDTSTRKMVQDFRFNFWSPFRVLSILHLATSSFSCIEDWFENEEELLKTAIVKWFNFEGASC